MDKKYISSIASRAPRARSKRLREIGAGSSATSIISAAAADIDVAAYTDPLKALLYGMFTLERYDADSEEWVAASAVDLTEGAEHRIKANYGLYSNDFISVLGVSDSGASSGGGYPRLTSWENYVQNDGSVPASDLLFDVKQDADNNTSEITLLKSRVTLLEADSSSATALAALEENVTIALADLDGRISALDETSRSELWLSHLDVETIGVDSLGASLIDAEEIEADTATFVTLSAGNFSTLALSAGAFSAKTFTPTGGNVAVSVPTTTDHIAEAGNLYYTEARVKAVAYDKTEIDGKVTAINAAVAAAEAKAQAAYSLLTDLFTKEQDGETYRIKANYGLYSEQFLSVLGVSSGGASAEGGYPRLTDWNNYVREDGSVPSSDLLWDVKQDVATNAGHIAQNLTSINALTARVSAIEGAGYATTSALSALESNVTIALADLDGRISALGETSRSELWLSHLDAETIGVDSLGASLIDAEELEADTATITTLTATTLNATLPWSAITGRETTLSGYGITDAYTKSEIDAKESALTGAISAVDEKADAISALLGRMFTLEGNDTDGWRIKANYGLYSNDFLSVLGISSDGGASAGGGYPRLESWNNYTENDGTVPSSDLLWAVKLMAEGNATNIAQNATDITNVTARVAAVESAGNATASQLLNYLPLTGGTLTGGVTLSTDSQGSANNTKGILFGTKGLISGNSVGGVGIYAVNDIYLRSSCGSSLSDTSHGIQISGSAIIPYGSPSLGTDSNRFSTIYASSQVYASGGFVGNLTGTASAAPWGGITGKPTTLSGYGITDAYTKGEIDAKESNVTIALADLDGRVSSLGETPKSELWLSHLDAETIGVDSLGASLIDAEEIEADTATITTLTATSITGSLTGNASTATNVAWTGVTGKPTWIGDSKPTYTFSELTAHPATLAGYGITDAYTKAETDAAVNAVSDRLDDLFTKEDDGEGGYRIKANYGLYTEQFLSVLGIGSGAGGGGSYTRLESWSDYVEGDGTVPASKIVYPIKTLAESNAGLIAGIDARVTLLEGKTGLEAFQFEQTGAGNAVTSVSWAGSKLTATKGSTFALADGSNATGTWAIGISGNAATATSAASASSATYATSAGSAASAGYTSWLYGETISNLNAASMPDAWGVTFNGYNAGASNKPVAYDNANAVVNINKTHQGTGATCSSQLAFPNNGAFYFRNISAGAAGAWKQIAFTDSNVASATYATSAGSASTADTAAYATSAGSAASATSATSADSATYAASAGSAASATNADTLDGYHETSFMRWRGFTAVNGEATLWSELGTKDYVGALPDGMASGYTYGHVASLPGVYSRLDLHTSDVGSYDSASYGLWWRSGYNATKRQWLKVIDSGNYASYVTQSYVNGLGISAAYASTAGSASQLATACSLWGQSFNGTGSVSGDLTGVGSITASGTIATTGAVCAGAASPTSGYNLDVAGKTLLQDYTRAYGHLDFKADANGYACVGINRDSTNGAVLGDNPSAWQLTLSLSSLNLTQWAGSLPLVINGCSVGIGTTSPSCKLHVIGDILASGGVTCLSDIRLKTDIDRTPMSAERIAECLPAKFAFADNPQHRRAGVIAQELREILPEAVGATNDGMLSVEYGNAALFLALSLAQEVARLKRELAELKINQPYN